ncbi:hypothetical protein Pan189_37360 [Stratiformator vulcanicus]|uniref:Uncharacterized protein n=1 Tax=Stratiformator vulcanicus TaxID=2527980 RepID=A0A517R637_9PLAN|nr:hypothetical protein Pan189_37360 [Stratiformator vulcanicus]
MNVRRCVLKTFWLLSLLTIASAALLIMNVCGRGLLVPVVTSQVGARVAAENGLIALLSFSLEPREAESLKDSILSSDSLAIKFGPVAVMWRDSNSFPLSSLVNFDLDIPNRSFNMPSTTFPILFGMLAVMRLFQIRNRRSEDLAAVTGDSPKEPPSAIEE